MTHEMETCFKSLTQSNVYLIDGKWCAIELWLCGAEKKAPSSGNEVDLNSSLCV